ncbi:MAG: WYL domain-containing protein [Actinomycetes bacterium]
MSESGVEKSERLINLTMALLASRRFLTKAEIFRSVEGYAGSPETMERMFERDKNDLRDLGLEIEVGSEDPLFEDEAGYRINPKRYSLDIGELDQTELALLSLAANQWQNSLLSKSGQRAIRKFESIEGVQEPVSLALPFVKSEIPAEHFALLWDAVESRKEVTFTYHSLQSTVRRVAPYGLGLHQGFWYLIGLDLDKSEIRNFKIVRIDSDLSAGKKAGVFDRPTDFSLSVYFDRRDGENEGEDAVLDIRVGKAQEIRAIASVQPLNDDWDRAEITYSSRGELFEMTAKSLTSAIITEPADLREEFIQWLKEKRHG